MKITILCSNKNHPVIRFLMEWKKQNGENHEIVLVNSKNDVESGDILFLISCTEIIRSEIRDRFAKTLVIHESDLPKGRGWSPISWLILEGSNEIPVTLLEAVDKVDSGPIWKKSFVKLEGHELFDEISEKVYRKKISLMNFAIEEFENVVQESQNNDNATYYERRTPEDHEIDIKRSIEEQFDKLRISDEKRFPSFFYFRNKKYRISLEKIIDKNFQE